MEGSCLSSLVQEYRRVPHPSWVQSPANESGPGEEAVLGRDGALLLIFLKAFGQTRTLTLLSSPPFRVPPE